MDNKHSNLFWFTGSVLFVWFMTAIFLTAGYGNSLIASLIGGLFLPPFVFAFGFFSIPYCVFRDSCVFSMADMNAGMVSFVATYMYALTTVCLLVISFCRPDPDGIPPAWKLFVMLKPSGATKEINRALDQDEATDLQTVTTAMQEERPFLRHEQLARKIELERTAARVEAETGLQKAEERLARASLERDKARIRAQEAKKRRF